ncbi:MAG: Flagellar hook-associated protein 2 [Pseudomonadota bacterium]|jgi:flagellar hook-associated protein 2
MATTTTTSATTTPVATTTATTASASSTAATTAANKANAQKILTSLGAGSGVDVNALAQNLVDAEKIPQQNAIQAKITKNTARISGYSAVSYVVSNLQTALTALKDQSSFSSVTASTSATEFGVTAGATAATGTHEVEVLQVAKAQRQISNGVATPTTALNGGLAMSFSITVAGGTPTAISVPDGKDTPQDIVDAVNASTTGVKAQLVNTGDGSATPYQIVLAGATGVAGAFTLSTSYGAGTGSPGLTFDPTNTANQSAADAKIKVDGITVTRSTNTIKDAVPGLTFDVRATTTTPALVNLTRDTTSLKDKFNALVSAYNDANSMFGVVTDPKSTVDTYGATLVGDSTVRNVRQQVRGIFQGASSTPGSTVNTLWQVGIKIDEKGVMSVDTTKLDSALQNNFSDVVKSFTGNFDNLSAYSTQKAGFAGDGVKKLSALLGPNGPMLSQSNNADTQNTKYKDDLAKLDTRMTALLARYTKQFAAMDSLVGKVNSQKTSLKSTFDGMMATYTNKN